MREHSRDMLMQQDGVCDDVQDREDTSSCLERVCMVACVDVCRKDIPGVRIKYQPKGSGVDMFEWWWVGESFEM